MELGLTIPLQRYLRQAPLPCGTELDRRLCGDLHVITLRGRKSLLAVHCHSRYTFVLYDLSPNAWADLPGTFLDGLGSSLSAAGIWDEAMKACLCPGKPWSLTKTHGRREVAFLNRAWDDVLALDYCLDETSLEQPLLDHAVNERPSRCAGFEGMASAAERIVKSIGGTI